MRHGGRNRMLTDAHRAAYDRDGFIVVPDVFSAEDVAELRRVTDEFVSASATVTANDSVYDLEDTHSADEPRVRRLKAPHAIHPVYREAPDGSVLVPRSRFRSCLHRGRSFGRGRPHGHRGGSRRYARR